MLKGNMFTTFYSKDDIELIHESVLRVFEEIGIKIEDEEALDIFRKHGARVEGDLVFISKELLDKALSTVPKSFELVGLENKLEIGIGKDLVVAPTNGCPYLEDWDGTYRGVNSDDLENFYKIINTSDVYGISSMVSADIPGFEDSPTESALAQMAMLAKYSKKPVYNILGVTPHNYKRGSAKEGARECIQLIKKYMDNFDDYVCYSGMCVLPPLTVGGDAIEHYMAFAEEKQPITITTCSMTNMTAPPSLMGSIVADFANMLAVGVLIQLKEPGLPIIFSPFSSITDMREVRLMTGAPEFLMMCLGHIAMGDYYQIPIRCGGALADGFTYDYQAGVESTLGALTITLTNGCILPHASGDLSNFNLLSFPKFMMDEEMLRYMKRLRQGVMISEEKASIDLLKKVGPRGNFLQGRTPKDYREETYLTSPVFNRGTCNEQGRAAAGDILTRAKAVYDERIASYQLPDVTKKQKDILNAHLPKKYQY
ncbi:trimethylamine methyltransferase family protein [Alkalibacter mobilis]|uniref:trimethylamine methyltransferase family protein n=1 Tax=Alkalibacter mobilis TaxID=2787712 RepID=UPI00189CE16E|nr:trimethylamine methyltransferase family protein [Alkalibacter mobilis]MBF7095659.1 trimethylamine methyltransferase family protein [Alkalibacter mobilis]